MGEGVVLPGPLGLTWVLTSRLWELGPERACVRVCVCARACSHW